MKNLFLLIFGCFLCMSLNAQDEVLQKPEEEAIKELENEIADLKNSDLNVKKSKDAQAVSNAIQKTSKLSTRVLSVEVDSFYDPQYDYSKFSGRVTDKDDTTSIIKISAESRNIKFFRAGDYTRFWLSNKNEDKYCEGFVRSLEEKFFVLYVKDLAPCFGSGEYFRRGTSLVFHSPKLLERVREASIFRASLFQKKKDFLSQLNQLNHDVWNYEEQKVKIAAEYDRKIQEIEKQKQMALEEHLSKKNDFVTLQKELIYRLDNIDKEISFYRIEKEEPLFDRWHKDHNLGYPVFERPEPLRAKND